MNYIEILGASFTDIEASCIGDPTNLADIVVAAGSILPTAEQFAAADLAIRQNNKWTDIFTERNRRYYDGVFMDGVDGVKYWFWTDLASRAQYSMYDIAIRSQNLQPSDVLDNWKTMDGRFTPMTVSQLYAVIDAAMGNEKVLFNLGEKKKADMLAMSDPDSYDALANWPTSYSDTLIVPAVTL